MAYNRSLVLVLVWCGIEILSRRFENSSKMKKNVKNGIFCRCLHGNSEHANKFLSIVLVTMACCLYYVKVNYKKKKRNFTFSENLRLKKPHIDSDLL